MQNLSQYHEHFPAKTFPSRLHELFSINFKKCLCGLLCNVIRVFTSNTLSVVILFSYMFLCTCCVLPFPTLCAIWYFLILRGHMHRSCVHLYVWFMSFVPTVHYIPIAIVLSLKSDGFLLSGRLRMLQTCACKNTKPRHKLCLIANIHMYIKLL